MTKPAQGFTLAELAIVLIIIGVLLTGVLMAGKASTRFRWRGRR